MKCVKGAPRIILFGEAEYPAQLRQVALPPPQLMVRGPLIPSSGRLLTITGSVEPSFEARRIAYDFARTCAHCRVHPVLSHTSGIARYALYGAWEGKRESVVVFDSPLPHVGWKIPSAILLTPFMDLRIGSLTRQKSAAAICGALGEATLVIETPGYGASLAVAHAALDGGREVFVHAVGTKEGPWSEGSRALVEMGAPVVSSFEEVALLLGWDGGGMV